jgi:ferrous iron transport protein B
MAMIFRRFMFAGEAEPFVMEMPPYHMPTLRNVAMQMWERAGLYFKKAGTLILGASILVWFLMSYPMDVTYSKDYGGMREQIEIAFEQESASLLAPLGITAVENDPALAGAVASLSAQAANSKSELPANNGQDKIKITDNKNIDRQLYPIASAYVALQEKTEDAKDVLVKEQHAEKLSQSYAASFGHFFEPVLQPLGYDWRIGVALVAATAAKEVMVSTLGTIYSIEADTDDDSSLQDFLAADKSYNPAMALSLITFTLLYSPCLAALSVIKRETNSWKWMGFVFAYTCVLAWFGAFAVYHIALAAGLGSMA